jgi:uncharacterized membrane protein
MMDLHVILKIAHVIGGCVLFGTGLGIAFFVWMANRTAEPAIIAVTVGIVVIADTIFTATAVVAQPVTGAALAHMMGIPLLSTAQKFLQRRARNDNGKRLVKGYGVAGGAM